MSLRKIESVADNIIGRVAIVYRDAEWDEYRVTFIERDVRKPEADYHTDDKGDAQRTARSWAWAEARTRRAEAPVEVGDGYPSNRWFCSACGALSSIGDAPVRSPCRCVELAGN